ncbi:MAG: hypothetical protein QM756_30050 [Polyangiaceae bacterium]
MKALLFGVGGSIALAALVVACGSGSQAAKAPLKEVAGVPSDDRSRCDYKGRADREVSEAAGPGAKFPNIRRVFGIVGQGEERRRVLLCREVDTNLDGAKDIVRTFNDKGEPLSELSDSNYDGKIDTWISFTRGRVAKMQLDTAGRGSADETRFYVGGKLSRAQRDTNQDGKPDVWEVYEEGKLQRIGVDLDFDGHVDRWDRDEIALRENRRQGARRDRGPREEGRGREGARAERGARRWGHRRTRQRPQALSVAFPSLGGRRARPRALR